MRTAIAVPYGLSRRVHPRCTVTARWPPGQIGGRASKIVKLLVVDEPYGGIPQTTVALDHMSRRRSPTSVLGFVRPVSLLRSTRRRIEAAKFVVLVF